MCRRCMPLEEKKNNTVRTEVAGDLTFNYNQCECGSITVTVDNGINVQSIATVLMLITHGVMFQFW